MPEPPEPPNEDELKLPPPKAAVIFVNVELDPAVFEVRYPNNDINGRVISV